MRATKGRLQVAGRRQSSSTGPRPHVIFHTSIASIIVILLHLALALLQVWLFGVLVGEGRSLDVALLPESLYRVDGLGLVFGVAWCLGMAMVVAGGRSTSKRKDWIGICLLTAGMLNAFYARLPFVFYMGWEVAGFGLWSLVRPSTVSHPSADDTVYKHKVHRRGLARTNIGWTLHVAGWPLLLMILLGLVGPFAPPAGGVAQSWPLPVILGLAAVVLIRSGCPPFDEWARSIQKKHASLLVMYMISAPMLLAKMLVAAPWDAVGGWALTLMGVAALLASVVVPVLRPEGFASVTMSATLAAATMAGFGLATGAPLAAAGAVAILLAGMVGAVAWGAIGNLRRDWLGSVALLGALPGMWLMSQGALGVGYSVVAALVLPAVAALAMGAWQGHISLGVSIEDSTLREDGSRTASIGDSLPSAARYTLAVKVAAILAVLIAAYPQALVELGVRPAVGAMAGGVNTLALLRSNWGVGLNVAAAQGSAPIALPATGIAVAVILTWAALYWLKGIVSRFVREQVPEAKAE